MMKSKKNIFGLKYRDDRSNGRNWKLTKLVLDEGLTCEEAAKKHGLSRAMGPKIVKEQLKRYFDISKWKEMDVSKVHLNTRIEFVKLMRDNVKKAQELRTPK